jgi:hypothetical protein
VNGVLRGLSAGLLALASTESKHGDCLDPPRAASIDVSTAYELAVELEKPRVVLARARRTIWGALSGQPLDFAFSLSEADVERVFAPISFEAVAALAELWDLSGYAVCARGEDDTVILDGVAYLFERSDRGARVHSPGQGTIGAAMIGIGERLVAYAAAPPAARPRLEASLMREARELAERIKRRSTFQPVRHRD